MLGQLEWARLTQGHMLGSARHIRTLWREEQAVHRYHEVSLEVRGQLCGPTWEF